MTRALVVEERAARRSPVPAVAPEVLLAMLADEVQEVVPTCSRRRRRS